MTSSRPGLRGRGGVGDLLLAGLGELVAGGAGTVARDRMGVEVDEPVLGHAPLLVELELEGAVALGGAGREDLYHEVGRPEQSGGRNVVAVLGEDHHEVGLHHVGF